MIYLAFYRGEGRFLSDTLVQRVTRSEFSHCELFTSDTPPLPGETHLCVSAVGKHGGVCEREMTFRPGAYEFVPVPWAPADTVDRARRHMGSGYDYWGLLMTQFINMRRHAPDRWFCSKLCAKALGLADAHTYAPGDLKRIVEEHNRTYMAAQEVTIARKATAPRRYGVTGAPVFPGSGTFAGGLLAARQGAAAVMSQFAGPAPDGGLRAAAPASVPARAAHRSSRLAGQAARPTRLPEANVVQFPGQSSERIAR